METITNGKWLWYDIMSDLKAHGCKVTMDPLSTQAHFMVGECEEISFAMTWVKDRFMLVTTTGHKRKLIDALSDIVEYLPFAMYCDKVSFTFEWDKCDPGSRWKELQGKGSLVKL